MKVLIVQILLLLGLIWASCEKPIEVEISRPQSPELEHDLFIDSLKQIKNILTQKDMSLESKLNNLDKYKPEVKALIEELLQAAKDGELGGSGGSPDIPLGTEFNTGKSLAGSVVYGLYIESQLVGSFSDVVIVSGIDKIVSAGSWTVAGSTTEISESHFNINAGDVRLFNRSGSSLDIGVYIEYTKL